MEPRKGSGPIAVTEPVIGDCGETSRRLHLEAASSSELCDAKPLEPQPTRSLKWTAIRLFGGRRSICSLPSFFRGRKFHGKGPSKKGINKSKTHDGLSEVRWEDGGRGGDVPTKDFEYRGQKAPALSCSNTSQVMSDFSEGGESSCLPTLSSDHKAFWEKSLNFRRPKRGLKGFFSSLRRPKKQRNIEKGNCEAFELVGDTHELASNPADSDRDDLDTKSVGNLVEAKSVASVVKDTLTVTCEVNDEAVVPENGIDCTKQESVISHTSACEDLEPAANALNVATEAENPCTDVNLTLSPVARPKVSAGDEQCVLPADQIGGISADEASLKSFDSLTGCGDVIADRDQDEDSMTDRTVLGEKGHSATKRSSSYVNYQGGGEEMATTDEVGSIGCLRGLWEGEIGELDHFPQERPGNATFNTSLADAEAPLIPSSHIDAGGNCSSLPHGVSSSYAQVHILTPQSDQQGSLPNSDEGYYDSTTPGPEEDRRDDSIRIVNERLPRDSYSGDALYELYESEDTLTSPAVDGKRSTATTSSTLDSLDFVCLMSPSFEEERLSVQHGVEISTATEQAEFKFGFKTSPTEFLPKVNKKQAHQIEGFVLGSPSLKGERNSGELKFFIDRNKGGQSESRLEKAKDNYINGTKGEDVIFTDSQPVQDSSTFVAQGHRGDPPVTLGGTQPSRRVEVEAEHSQTVCFSQALVSFNNNTRPLGHSSRSLVGPEPGSVLVQNIENLPTMVTFDVFDTDNEGECDCHTEMEIETEMEIDMEMEGTDEDVESLYESSPYESYLQKDAFAEWDDKVLNDFDRSLFTSNTWRVASLPRYYGLAGISPSLPASLSAKRRSRSLDTDTLESEINDFYLSDTKPNPASLALPKPEQCFSKISPAYLKTNGYVTSPEMQARTEPAMLGQQRTSGHPVPLFTNEKRIGCVPSALERERSMPEFFLDERAQSRHTGQGTKYKIRPPLSKRVVLEKSVCNSTPQNPGQMVKSSHLLVQYGPHGFQPDPSMSGTPGEFLCWDPAQVSALDDDRRARFSQTDSATHLQKCTQPPSKIRPVGITRGMPHFHPDTNQTSKLPNCKAIRECTSKSREDLSLSLPVGVHKHSV